MDDRQRQHFAANGCESLPRPVWNVWNPTPLALTCCWPVGGGFSYLLLPSVLSAEQLAELNASYDAQMTDDGLELDGRKDDLDLKLITDAHGDPPPPATRTRLPLPTGWRPYRAGACP